MSQEKNGDNTDLECDLVLCRNMDSEKGGNHKISQRLPPWKCGYGIGWRRSVGQSTYQMRRCYNW